MEKRGASPDELREFIMGERAKKSWMEREVDLEYLLAGKSWA
jgi:hypothetical protein